MPDYFEILSGNLTATFRPIFHQAENFPLFASMIPLKSWMGFYFLATSLFRQPIRWLEEVDASGIFRLVEIRPYDENKLLTKFSECSLEQ